MVKIWVLSLMLALQLSLIGCAWWNTKGKVMAKDVVDCAIESVRSHAPALLPRIYEILDGNPANWNAALTTLSAAGWDAFACAAQTVITDFFSKATVAKNPTAKALHLAKAEGLRAFLLSQGYRGVK